MRKLIIALLICLCATSAWANPVLLSGTATGTTQVRFSLVDGTAFIDTDGTIPLAPYIGEQLEVCDSSSRCIRGTIKAGGTGETLGSDLVTNGDFSSSSGWGLGAGWSIGSGIASCSTGGAARVWRADIASLDMLVKLSLIGSSYTSGTLYGLYNAASPSNRTASTISGDGAKTCYMTSKSATSIGIVTGDSGFVGSVDDLQIYQVTAPSITGAIIVKSPGSTTYNWGYKHASFDPNSASAYKWRIISSNNPGSVASLKGKCTGTTQCRFSLVDGTAFVDGDGTIPVASHVGSVLRVRDSSGYEIVGVIKAAGSGETLGTDVLAGWDFTSGWIAMNASVTDANTINITSTPGGVYKLTTLTLGRLYKATLSATGVTALGDTYGNVGATSASSPGYFVARTASAYFFASSALGTTGSKDVTTMQEEPVLTPSITGATIVSTTGGSTYNWASKHASFNPNESTAYTWEILPYSVGTVTSSDVHLATVDGGAMVEISGVDLSPYAGDDTGGVITIINPHSTSAATMTTNKYLLTLYDSSGRSAAGYVGSSGGGETLDTEIMSDTGFDDAGVWAGNFVVSGGVATGTYATSNVLNQTGKTFGAGWLVKNVYTMTRTNGSAYFIIFGPSTSFTTRSSNDTFTEYKTVGSGFNGNVGFYSTTTFGGTIDNVSLKRALDVATTGVHLHSSPNATDRKLARKDTSFDPNAVVAYKLYCVGPCTGDPESLVVQSDGGKIILNPYSSRYLKRND